MAFCRFIATTTTTKASDVVLKQTCRSSVAARLSETECFTAADGDAGRPGWFQKVTQWNDASKT